LKEYIMECQQCGEIFFEQEGLGYESLKYKHRCLDLSKKLKEKMSIDDFEKYFNR